MAGTKGWTGPWILNSHLFNSKAKFLTSNNSVQESPAAKSPRCLTKTVLYQSLTKYIKFSWSGPHESAFSRSTLVDILCALKFGNYCSRTIIFQHYSPLTEIVPFSAKIKKLQDACLCSYTHRNLLKFPFYFNFSVQAFHSNCRNLLEKLLLTLYLIHLKITLNVSSTEKSTSSLLRPFSPFLLKKAPSPPPQFSVVVWNK